MKAYLIATSDVKTIAQKVSQVLDSRGYEIILPDRNEDSIDSMYLKNSPKIRSSDLVVAVISSGVVDPYWPLETGTALGLDKEFILLVEGPKLSEDLVRESGIKNIAYSIEEFKGVLR